eukprot:10446118-Alexandrium_andersonii.AAC.1
MQAGERGTCRRQQPSTGGVCPGGECRGAPPKAWADAAQARAGPPRPPPHPATRSPGRRPRPA